MAGLERLDACPVAFLVMGRAHRNGVTIAHLGSHSLVASVIDMRRLYTSRARSADAAIASTEPLQESRCRLVRWPAAIAVTGAGIDAHQSIRLCTSSRDLASGLPFLRRSRLIRSSRIAGSRRYLIDKRSASLAGVHVGVAAYRASNSASVRNARSLRRLISTGVQNGVAIVTGNRFSVSRLCFFK